MSFTIKNIDIELTPESLAKAMAQIELIQGKLQPAMTHLIEQMIEKGVEIARAELIFFDNPAFDTGALSDSIGCGMQSESEGVVTTGAMYAVYVEYGTGEYAAGGDGRQGGWTYFDTRTGQFRHTFGMAPRPFMLNTYNDLREEIMAAGGRIVAEYLAE